MGSSASKAARKAPSARQYPTRIPRATPNVSQDVNPRAANRHDAAEASQVEAHERPTNSPRIQDQSDLGLDSRLRHIGPVRPESHGFDGSQSPFNTQSNAMTNGLSPQFPTPANNPALAVLSARQRFQESADAEFNAIGRKNFRGRRFLDAGTIRQALVLRDERGMSVSDIERLLGAQPGVLSILGAKGLVSAAATTGEGFGERGA